MAGAVTDTIQVAARVPVDLAERLNKLADENERTASAELRIALRAHVEAGEAQRAKAVV